MIKNKGKILISLIFGLLITSLSFSLFKLNFNKDICFALAPQGGAIQLSSSSTFNMNNGTITGSSAEKGGAIYIGDGAIFTMNGGTISNCDASYGGAIYVASGGKCYLQAGKISNCSSTSGGNAIYVEEGGYLEMGAGFVIEGSGANYTASIKAINPLNVKRPVTVTPYVDGTKKTAINTYSNVVINTIGLPNKDGCGWYEESSYSNKVMTTNIVSTYAENDDLNLYFSSHSYNGWLTTISPTCQSRGEEINCCNICGYTKTQQIEKVGHYYSEFVRTYSATCISQGYDEYSCQWCSDYTFKNYTSTNSSNHVGGTTTTEGHSTNCMTFGYIKTTCNGCSAIISTNCYAIHEMDNGTVIQSPTCILYEEKQYSCTRQNCQYSYNETGDRDASVHSMIMQSSGNKNNCTQNGYIEYYCYHCGTVTDTSSYSSHSYSSAVDRTENPTCTTGGYNYYCCTRTGCQVEKKELTSSALGHLYEYTSEYGGLSICSDCGFSVSGVASGCHVWVYEPMIQNYECYNCGAIASAPHRAIPERINENGNNESSLQINKKVFTIFNRKEYAILEEDDNSQKIE